ncbi:O-antigen ligase family protein [Haliangium sp.]|uniref:O-antigen ligase family protein n=1 Tax=Haliangium sp. TaxID=2663208 RepID=UPI003D09C92C
MDRRDLPAAILCALAVVGSLAALGGVTRWAACVSAGLGLACLLPYARARRRASLRQQPLVATLALATAATALQVLPLPVALVGWLSPPRLALAENTAAALGETVPMFVALSYDPPATLVALAVLAGGLGFAAAATRLAAGSRGRVWLATAVAGAGAALALCGLLHHVLGLEAVYGLYTPADAAPRYPAPLLGENHFAGYLSLAAPLALVLAVRAAGPRRLLWVAALALCVATNLLLASRGGALSLAVGLVAAIALLVVQARHRPAPAGQAARRLGRAVVIPAGVVVVCALILTVVLSGDRIRAELAATSLDELNAPRSKFAVWGESLALIRAHPLTGVGRGGFESAFTRFEASGVKSYSHVENEYLQAVVDWGVVAGLAVLAGLIWLAWRGRRGWSGGPVEAGAAAAGLGLAVHAVTDFHVELPAVLLSAIAVAAVVVPAPRRGRTGARAWRRPGLVRGAALAAGAALVVLAASPVGTSAREDEAAMRAVLDAAGPDQPIVRSEPVATEAQTQAIQRGRDAVRRHPADYLLAGLLAQAYFRARDPAAVRWVNRALTRNPSHPGLHVSAAHMLIASGHRDQALIEYAAALARTAVPRPILIDLLAEFPAPAEAARGIPVRPERLVVITPWLIALGRADVALAYARRVYERFPDDADSQRITAELALRGGDLDLAVAAGELAFARTSSVGEAVVLGTALYRLGRLDRALAVLDQGLERRSYREPWELMRLHLARSRVQAERGDAMAARADLRLALRLAPVQLDSATRASLHRRLAELEDALGNPAGAARARARARELVNGDGDRPSEP